MLWGDSCSCEALEMLMAGSNCSSSTIASVPCWQLVLLTQGVGICFNVCCVLSGPAAPRVWTGLLHILGKEGGLLCS